MFLSNFITEDVRNDRQEYLSPGGHGEQIWRDLDPQEGDLHIRKNRYSALTSGASMLRSALSSHGTENILITGTKTNICCESTGRDAMQLDYQVIMVEDCCAALSDEEHRSALENIIQQFGDVMTVDEVVAVMKNQPND